MRTIQTYQTRGGKHWAELREDEAGFEIDYDNGCKFLGCVTEDEATKALERHVEQRRTIDGTNLQLVS